MFCLGLWHSSFKVKNVSGCKFGLLCLFDCLFPIFKRHLKMPLVNGLLGSSRFSASLEEATLHCSFHFWTYGSCELITNVNYSFIPKEISFVMMIMRLKNFGLILCYFLKVSNLFSKELQVYYQYNNFFSVSY